jgi:hypothetical protein
MAMRKSQKSGNFSQVLCLINFEIAFLAPQALLVMQLIGLGMSIARTSRRGSQTIAFAPTFLMPFWCKEVFEDFCFGKWGFNHPIQAADVDNSFSIFAFILSVDKTASWPPPRIPSDSLTIDDMIQLGKNVLWFMDLALAQPGQTGSLFINFSLVGAALVLQLSCLISGIFGLSGTREPHLGSGTPTRS